MLARERERGFVCFSKRKYLAKQQKARSLNWKIEFINLIKCVIFVQSIGIPEINLWQFLLQLRSSRFEREPEPVFRKHSPLGGSIAERLVSSFTSLDSTASLHTNNNKCSFWSNPILLNWRLVVQWSFPQRWVLSAVLIERDCVWV